MNSRPMTNQELIEENSILKRKIEERERSESECKRAEQEMVILADIGRLIGSTLNISEVYEQVAAEVQKLISFDRLCVNLHDFDQGVLKTVYVSGEYIAGRQPGDLLPLKGSMSEALIINRRGIYSHSRQVEEMGKRFHDHADTIKAGMQSLLSVPLISRDEMIGVLHFRSKNLNAYAEQDLRLAERIGMQIAGAIANAQLYMAVKETEKSLRENEEKYRILFEGINDAVFVHEFDEEGLPGRFLQVNEVACRRLGYSREELLSLTPRDITIPEEYERIADKRMNLASRGDILTETIHLTADGRKIPVESNIRQFQYFDKQVALSISRDITDRKRAEMEKNNLEERLQRAQKMEALGTLAGGVSHDFNNLLMGIQGNTSLMLLDLDTSHPHYERLKRIEQQVQSGADLAKQLLGVAREGRYEVKATDMNSIIETSSSMFGRTKKEITIHRKYRNDLWNVEVDQEQMEPGLCRREWPRGDRFVHG
jgi:PAS domain S-box-containing protein